MEDNDFIPATYSRYFFQQKNHIYSKKQKNKYHLDWCDWAVFKVS